MGPGDKGFWATEVAAVVLELMVAMEAEEEFVVKAERDEKSDALDMVFLRPVEEVDGPEALDGGAGIVCVRCMNEGP